MASQSVDVERDDQLRRNDGGVAADHRQHGRDSGGTNHDGEQRRGGACDEPDWYDSLLWFAVRHGHDLDVVEGRWPFVQLLRFWHCELRRQGVKTWKASTKPVETNLDKHREKWGLTLEALEDDG